MTVRPRRSVLYMPGANQRALDKARTLPADTLILDLEDSVAPESKLQARDNVCAAVRSHEYGSRELVIRVNALETPWGSADLFQKCCEAPEAMKKKSDEDDAEGRLNEITIEVCRESGDQNEGKFPFLITTYKRVYITKYSVDFSGPEPTETIEFQYEEFKFEYVATDPYTGAIKKQGSAKSAGMANHPQPQAAASLAATPAGSAAISLAGSAAATAMGGAPGAAAAAGVNGAPSGAASGADAAVAANFPGFASVTGNGVLPD